MGGEGGGDDVFVDGFAGGHEAVAEVGVLVEFVFLAGGLPDIFVVAWLEGFGHAAGGRFEGGLEDDLGATAAEVEHCCCGGFIGAADLAEEVVGCYPGVDAFVFAVHDFDAAVGFGDEGEGVGGFETGADGGEDLGGEFFAELAEAGGGFDGNGGAGFQFVGDVFHGEVEKGVETFGGAFRVCFVG